MKALAFALLAALASPLIAAPASLLSPEEQTLLASMVRTVGRASLDAPGPERVDAMLNRAFADAAGLAPDAPFPCKPGPDLDQALARLEACAIKAGAKADGFSSRVTASFLTALDGESAILTEADLGKAPDGDSTASPPAKARLQEDATLLITIPGLYQETTRQIQDLLTPSGPAPRRIILDLRGNQGGLLDEVTHVASLFVAAGAGGALHGPNHQTEALLVPAAPKGHDHKTPLIVLVDGQTASGAEMLAAILQDRRRATIAGSRTMGHGTIHSLFMIRRNTYLKLVTGQMSRADGRMIKGLGVSPDLDLANVAPAQWIETPTKAARPSLSATNR